MAQVPECVVCLQPYDDYLHVPRVLACGHSFCELCLMQLQSARNPSLTKSEDSQAAVAVIRCPECSQRTRLPVGGSQYLPKNVELLRLLPNLLKDVDFAEDREIDSRENNSASRTLKGTRILSERGLEGPARNRKENERRLDAKGKKTVESKGSSATVAGSTDRWLVPCELYSNNLNGDVRAWILPEKAIKLREDYANFCPVATSVRQLLHAEVVFEQTRLRSNVLVTLLRLELMCPKDETLSYEQCVLKAWEDSHSDIKTELLILFRISLVCRRLCNVFGLWMNSNNELFLVSEISSHDTVFPWEMIQNSCQNSNLSADASRVREPEESGTDGDEIVSLSDGMSQCELQKEPTKISPTVSMDILTKVGLGLCEIFLEIHAQGVIIGASTPNSFVLDRFGKILFNFNAALNDRLSIHEMLSCYRSLRDTEFDLEGHGILAEDDWIKSQHSKKILQYISPEVLSLLIDNLPNSQGIMISEWNSTNASEQAQDHWRITSKADVYSLGCFLLEVIAQKSPHAHLSFNEILHKVLVKREKPAALLLLDYGAADSQARKDIKYYEHIQRFKNLLSKCFEYNPDERPELDEIWQSLVEIIPSLVIPKQTISKIPQSELTGVADQKYWILCLPGFVTEGFLDSRHSEGASSQDPQTFLQNRGQVDRREVQSCGLELNGSLEGHQDFVTALVVCGDHLLSASFDKTICVWSLEDHQLQQTFKGHSHVVTALAVDQHHFICLSGDNGGEICAWKLGDNILEPLLTTWQEHKNWRYTGVASLAVSADGILYSGSGDRTIKSWSLRNFDLLGKMEGHKSVVSALLVDGELLYSGSWDGMIHIWWRSDQSPVAVLGDTTLVPSLGGVRTLYMSDSFLFAGRDNGAIQIWKDEECLTTVQAHDMVVSTLYVEGDFLYTASWDQKIKAWKVDEFLSDPTPAVVKECGSPLSSIVSDGDRLYAALADKTIKMYSLLGDTWASLVQMLNP